MVLAQMLQLIYRLSFRISKKGENNKISLDKRVMLWKGKIKIFGNDNLIVINRGCKLKYVKFQINGDNNHVVFGRNIHIYENAKILIEGDNCSIKIGDFTTIGSADILCGESKTHIHIGKDCMISRSVQLNTSDFHSIIDLKSGDRINPPGNILIADHVWVGYNAYIGKGGQVGKGSVIASKALLSGKTFLENTLIGGLPAIILKEGIDWSREKLPINPEE